MFPGLQRIKEAAGIPFIFSVEGNSLTSLEIKFIRESNPSGFIFFRRNVENCESLQSLISSIKKISDKTIIYSIDEEGGRVRRLPAGDYSLPSAEELGSWSDEKIRNAVSILAKKLYSIGINMDMAPCVDLRSGEKTSIVGDRSFGENPDFVTKKGTVYIKALHSEKVAGVIKHFPGHGTTTVDSHKSLPVIDKPFSKLIDEDLAPYKMMNNIAKFVMVSHILVPEIAPLPATLSPKWNNILKNTCNFKGMTILDDMEMLALDTYSIEDKVALFIEAGYDFMPVCSGKSDIIHHFYEIMVKNIEKDKSLISKFESLHLRLNNEMALIS